MFARDLLSLKTEGRRKRRKKKKEEERENISLKVKPARLSLCQAEGTDLITSSLAGLQPDGGRSWKQEELSRALLVTGSQPPSSPADRPDRPSIQLSPPPHTHTHALSLPHWQLTPLAAQSGFISQIARERGDFDYSSVSGD